jgi:transposase
LPHQRATQRLKAQVFHQHSQGVSQCDLAKNFNLGQATIERWYHRSYQLENQFIKNRHWPSVLGIDEHSFRKRQFATTFCDLKRHKVFDIAKGKSANEISAAFNDVPGRERVKVVCIDLSSTYRSFTKRYFPNALIVTGRFHVLRLVEHAFMQTTQSITPDIKYQRGILAMLRTNPHNLSEHKKAKLYQFLLTNPAIHSLYDFKTRILDLLKLKHRKARHCQKLAPIFLDFIRQLKSATFEPLVTLGKTLFKWRDEIARMWRFTKNNGITEGFHRKMKLIQRRAYGFKNFENYRLRVKVLCS